MEASGNKFADLTKLAKSYFATKQFVAAIPVLTEAVNICPDSPGTWSNLGYALWQVGRHHDAVLCYQNALTLKPDESAIASNLVSSLPKVDLSKLDASVAKRAFQRVFADAFARFPGIDAKISPVMTFENWRSRNSPETVEIDPEQTIHLKHEASGSDDIYVAGATRVVEVADASVIAGWDYVIASSGDVLEGSGHMTIQQNFPWMPHVLSQPAGAVLHTWPPEAAVYDEPTLFLSVPPKYQFGHWIMDFLPRLRAHQSLASRTPVKIAVPSSLPSRHRELLARFEIEDTEIVELELGRRYRFKSLWVVQQGHRYNPQIERISFLRKFMFLPPENADTSPNPRRVFL